MCQGFYGILCADSGDPLFVTLCSCSKLALDSPVSDRLHWPALQFQTKLFDITVKFIAETSGLLKRSPQWVERAIYLLPQCVNGPLQGLRGTNPCFICQPQEKQ
jgi:hypothetical protein